MLLAPALHAEEGEKWSSWIEFGGVLSSERDRGEATVFAPLSQDTDSLLFLDVRAKLFEQAVYEGNAALGYRSAISDGWALGAWGGVDVRQSDLDNTFYQTSLGLEAFSADHDIRLNGYVPISDDKNGASASEVVLSGPQIYLAGGREVPLYGFDGEIGTRLPLDFLGADPDTHELRVYAGGFFFTADDDEQIEDDVAGPRARLEWRISDLLEGLPGSRLTFETEYQYDEVREDQFEAAARLRIPLFGSRGPGPKLSPLERRLSDALVRDTDIVTARGGREGVRDASTGVPLTKVVEVDAGGSLSATSAAAGANSLIIVDGAAGTFNEAVTIGGRQTVAGGGSSFAVRGLKSGVVRVARMPGAAPTLRQGGANDIITLSGSSTHLVGLRLNGAGFTSFDGIYAGSGKRNMFLDDLMLRNIGRDGINFDDNGEVTVRNVQIDGVAGDGIDLDDGNRGVFENVTITDVGSEGFSINDGNNVRLSNVDLSALGDDGIDADDGNTLRLTNVTIRDAVNSGVIVDDGNRVEGANVKIRDATDGFVALLDNVVSFDGLTIRDVADFAIAMIEDNLGSFSDVTITRPGAFGVFADTNNEMSLENVTIANGSLGGMGFNILNDIEVRNNSITGTPIGVAMVGGNQFVGEALSIDNAAAVGLAANVGNIVDLLDSSITNTNTAVALESGNLGVFADSSFGNTAGDVFDFNAGNSLSFSGLTFTGFVGGDVFDFDGAGNVVSGSSGNENAIGLLSGSLCEASGGGAFAGTIGFTDGTVLQDNVAPCN